MTKKQEKLMDALNLKEVNNKEEARSMAIAWQSWASEQSLSYGELAYYQDIFYTLAKKYNLIREFKENGIL